MSNSRKTRTAYGYWGTDTDVLCYRDGRQVRVGTTHKMKDPCKPRICRDGMHAAFRPNDIIQSKSQSMTKIYLVRLQGDIINHTVNWKGEKSRCDDKMVGRERLYMGVVTGRDLPERFVKYQGDGVYHFNWHFKGFNDAVRKAFMQKYPEYSKEIESTLNRPKWLM